MAQARSYEIGSVVVSSSPVERFEEFLVSRGKRMTQQRRCVVQTVFERHEHFEADDLVEELSKRGEDLTVSRPTVYRTINEMVAAGLLRKISLLGRTVFEHDYGYPQHDHLYCQECQKLIEFKSEELIEIRQAVAKEHRFRVHGYRLVITGVCEECQLAKRRVRRPVDLV